MRISDWSSDVCSPDLLQYPPGYRSGDFHDRLIRHQVGKWRVLFDHLTHRHMPGNDLGFGDTFSNVGQLKQIVGHRLKPQEFASKRRPAVWGRGNIPTRRHEDMACPTLSPVRPALPGRRNNVPERS